MPDGKDETPNEATPVSTQVTTRDVSCDGGLGANGHPKVYLRIVHGRVGCPYCSRQFILKPGAAGDASH